MAQADIEYFDRGRVENPLFWSRLGGKPDFRDALVVDVGCGHGSLCIDIGLSGAAHVVGLDLHPHRIDVASENLRANYPGLVGTIEFRLQSLDDAPENDVDFFVSKDTFEHIIGLEQVLAQMASRLKVGGRVYTGFGPLWNSPFGDHGRTRTPIPWGHAVVPERYLIAHLRRISATPVASFEDLGLNALSGRLPPHLRFMRLGDRVPEGERQHPPRVTRILVDCASPLPQGVLLPQPLLHSREAGIGRPGSGAAGVR
jgi:SAM-dependent methyltransferase